MTTKFNRDVILKNCFFDLRAPEREQQLQGWLTNVVMAVEPKSVAEAVEAVSSAKRKFIEAAIEPLAGKVSLHNMSAAFFANRKPVRTQPEPKPDPTNEKKSGPSKS